MPGQLGFRVQEKSTPFAAQQAAEEAAKKAMEHGIKVVEFVKGPDQVEKLLLDLCNAVRS